MLVENIGEFGKIVVTWKYGNRNNGSISVHTICEINTINKERISRGMAQCSPKDNFCKNRGRKISLQRALLSFNVEQRLHFWEAYLKMRNGKW